MVATMVHETVPVTLLAAATVGDVIEFHVFDTFSVADAVTNQGGAMFGDLTVEVR